VALRKDIWRVGVLAAPAEALLSPERLANAPVTWLPEADGPLGFIADPFPLRREGRLHLFVEAYDYRERRGRIDVITLDEAFRPVERRRALAEPWHLSYPFVFEAEGGVWMLPEAHRSGALTLYRAEAFPTAWRPAARIALDAVPIDATPLFRDGLWWLFYTPATTQAAKVGELHLAFAERLEGPWRPHPGNPVRRDPGSSRPGGVPFAVDDRLVLPVQDCRRTYGGAIRPLVIETLTPDRFVAEAGAPFAPPPSFAPQRAGLHTWSAAGEVTFIDAKRLAVSPGLVMSDLARAPAKLRRMMAR
jgi:hypothetical protein